GMRRSCWHCATKDLCSVTEDLLSERPVLAGRLRHYRSANTSRSPKCSRAFWWVSKRRPTLPCALSSGSDSISRQGSKPAFFLDDIAPVKLFIRLGQIDDPLDDANGPHDDAPDPEGEHSDEQHHQSWPGHAEDELVDAQTADNDGTYARGDLEIC